MQLPVPRSGFERVCDFNQAGMFYNYSSSLISARECLSTSTENCPLQEVDRKNTGSKLPPSNPEEQLYCKINLHPWVNSCQSWPAWSHRHIQNSIGLRKIYRIPDDKLFAKMNGYLVFCLAPKIGLWYYIPTKIHPKSCRPSSRPCTEALTIGTVSTINFDCSGLICFLARE